MGKTAIVYYSQHHGNTKKILDAIARSEHPTVLYVSHRRYLDKYADQVIEL